MQAIQSIGGFRGENDTQGVAELAGDYHNGPLSVIIPLGLFGVIGFLWFLGAGISVLYRNHKFGDPAFQRINTFLLAYFIAKTICFFAVFGSLYSDLVGFTGLLGLSVSVNGGLARKPVVLLSKPKMVFNRFKPPRGAEKPVGVRS